MRGCLGRHLAKVFINNFFSPEFIYDSNFKPRENHLWSGRDNDVGNFKESLFQVNLFSRLIASLIYKRIFNIKN